MGNIQSTVPGSIKAFYDLLTVRGAAQSTPVSVYVGDLNEDEPANYVLLGHTPSGKSLVEGQRFEPAALGSGAVYEHFELYGIATSYVGSFDPLTAITNAWGVYSSVVMQTYINYWGGVGSIGGVGSPVLGSEAPGSLMEMVELDATDLSAPRGDGYFGTVEFGFAFKSRISIQ